MALQTSGAITLANIQTEFDGSNPISVSEYYRGGSNVASTVIGADGLVPSSGAISLHNFYGSLYMGTDAAWSARSYYSCADQHAGSTITYSPRPIKWTNKTYTVSNSGKLWQSTVGNDANDISQTGFRFSAFGYTYRIYNTTKNKYVQRKDYGADDSTYTTITAGAQVYNGYTYLTINIGWTSTVYIGNGDGTFNFDSVKGLLSGRENFIEIEYYYARNLHYASCTSAYLYALTFT